MAPEHVIDVEGRRIEALGNGCYLRAAETKRNTALGSMKRRISQGQAMRSTLGRRPRHPHRATLVIARRQFIGSHQRFVGLLPGLEPAF